MEQLPVNSVCGPTPQHRTFTFPSGISISSDFDSGNLGVAEQISPFVFHLWTATDCSMTQVEAGTRTWFYFEVRGATGTQLTLVIKNLNNQNKLFREGLKPVWKKGSGGSWIRVPGDVTFGISPETSQFEVSINHMFECDSEFFAFSYPWSYAENLKLLDELENRASHMSVYWHRACLIHSAEGLRCDLLTISSSENMSQELESAPPGLYPLHEFPSRKFIGKRVAFITARVHPGETAASHMLNGFLKFLLSGEDRAQALLQHFVFKIVPMLNPDGVFRGFYRTGVTGANENRFYLNPSVTNMPVIWAVKELFCSMEREVMCYIDLHAHATKPGCFVFGNYLGDFQKQVEALLFAKLMALNCPNFELAACSFSEKDMMTRDKGTNLSKEGCGRVVAYQVSKSPLCYTLECNYHSGKIVHSIPVSGLQESVVSDVNSELYALGPPAYDIRVFEDIGKAMGVSLLDYIDANPFSRLRQSDSQTLNKFRLETARSVAEMVPYRNFTDVRNGRKTEEGLQALLRGDTLKSADTKPIGLDASTINL